ncbi:GntR family transcriptional regulator [Heyndrickxia oleronia]|jgi:GntR family transcriptional regulator|uniref:GntR family transcriptional regulator n=1 Tax=Heyndrickxia oleronia TaxID=38875 RepID=A0A8E2I9T6_9BACI|nr:GntR family transcriptional regulator [Heyndrickxia oleronia]NYV65103.1 GntR family transcriptional regulator [Bacillus sp. Gen3]OJH20295.1 GntR family transcriptional regulator [Bacillus obstructivus]MBU5214198.1 GntR family transcriptional regulator [Heyndrickxia oleronia]MCI1589190.1 GntR family transcriptional regulator [Heyndrickxia oleronia]MCI1611721.1 GntR family transcriptional regulator [Heyndrickxia oleronia]
MIEKDNRVPLYYQLMDILMGKIEQGELKEHDRLPSERELCEQYNVSRTTVRQTMQELEKEGLIYKEHGKGTFVSPKVINQSLVQFYSFTEEMKKIGKKPSSIVLDFQTVSCESKVAKNMDLSVGELVFRITRLRLADGVPMMYETSFLPVKRFPDLTKEDLEQAPMYNLFRDKYQAIITRANERFKAVTTTEDEAKRLKMSTDEPSLLIERVTFEGTNVIEYTVSIARGDKFSYSVELK